MRLHIQPWGGEGHAQMRADGSCFEALVVGEPADGVYELVPVCPDPTDPTPRPYKQCPDCDGTGTQAGMSLPVDPPRPAPCPSCSVEPKQTEQNKGEPRWIPLR